MWTIKAENRPRIETYFEMWAYRCMLKMARIEKSTNNSILAEMGTKQRLFRIFNQWLMKSFENIVPQPVDKLEKTWKNCGQRESRRLDNARPVTQTLARSTGRMLWSVIKSSDSWSKRSRQIGGAPPIQADGSRSDYGAHGVMMMSPQ